MGFRYGGGATPAVESASLRLGRSNRDNSLTFGDSSPLVIFFDEVFEIFSRTYILYSKKEEIKYKKNLLNLNI
jgi:hypothetical protein